MQHLYNDELYRRGGLQPEQYPKVLLTRTLVDVVVAKESPALMINDARRLVL